MSFSEDDFDTEDRELPDASDVAEGDASTEVECPCCGRLMPEEATVCPHCGNYASEEDSSPRAPAWIVVGVIVCLLVVILMWLR